MAKSKDNTETYVKSCIHEMKAVYSGLDIISLKISQIRELNGQENVKVRADAMDKLIIKMQKEFVIFNNTAVALFTDLGSYKHEEPSVQIPQ
jgi:hypothetical protein